MVLGTVVELVVVMWPEPTALEMVDVMEAIELASQAKLEPNALAMAGELDTPDGLVSGAKLLLELNQKVIQTVEKLEPVLFGAEMELGHPPLPSPL